MTVQELEQRMGRWLSGDYRAVIYEDAGEIVAYALFREQAEEIYLRQLFVVRHRRSQGLVGVLLRFFGRKFGPRPRD